MVRVDELHLVIISPDVRWTVSGPRSTVITTFAAMGTYVRHQGPKAGLKQPISEVATMKWLTGCSLTACQQAVSAGVPVWFGVVGPGDILYLPGGALRAEKFLSEERPYSAVPLHVTCPPVSQSMSRPPLPTDTILKPGFFSWLGGFIALNELLCGYELERCVCVW